MRVADKQNYEQVRGSLSKNRSDMADLQNQAATMKKVNKPSDDPVGTTRVLAARTERGMNDQYLKNLNIAKSFLDSTESALADVGDSLLRVKELALSQVNDSSSNENTRKTIATEVDQIYRHFINIGNRKLGDRFLFGGFKTTESPFQVKGDYNGDDGEMNIEINKGVYVPINLSGDQVFHGKGIYEPAVWSEETTPEFTRDEETGAVQSNVHPSPQMRGPASVESEVPEKGVEVRNSKYQHVTKAGEVEDPRMGAQDGVNIFEMLQRIQTGLKTNDKRVIQDSLEGIDAAIEQIIVSRSRVGARLMNIDSVDLTLRKANIEARTVESKVQDADVYELMTDLSRTENTLKSSLSTSGKLIQPSLLDFLR